MLLLPLLLQILF